MGALPAPWLKGGAPQAAVVEPVTTPSEYRTGTEVVASGKQACRIGVFRLLPLDLPVKGYGQSCPGGTN